MNILKNNNSSHEQTANGDIKTTYSDGSTSFTQSQHNGVLKTYYPDGSTSTTIVYNNEEVDILAGIFGISMLLLSSIFAFTSVGRKQYILLVFLVAFIIALRFLRKRINPKVLIIWAQLCGVEFWMRIIKNVWESTGTAGKALGLISAVLLFPLILSYVINITVVREGEIGAAFLYFLIGFNMWISNGSSYTFIYNYAIYLIYGIWYIYGIITTIKYAKKKELFNKYEK